MIIPSNNSSAVWEPVDIRSATSVLMLITPRRPLSVGLCESGLCTPNKSFIHGLVSLQKLSVCLLSTNLAIGSGI